MAELFEGLYRDQWDAVRHYADQMTERQQEWFIGECDRRFADGDRWFVSRLESRVEGWMYSAGGPFSSEDDDGEMAEPDDQAIEWDLQRVLAVSELLLEGEVSDIRDRPGPAADHEGKAIAHADATFARMWEQLTIAAGEPPELAPLLALAASGPGVSLAELIAQAKRMSM